MRRVLLASCLLSRAWSAEDVLPSALEALRKGFAPSTPPSASPSAGTIDWSGEWAASPANGEGNSPDDDAFLKGWQERWQRHDPQQQQQQQQPPQQVRAQQAPSQHQVPLPPQQQPQQHAPPPSPLSPQPSLDDIRARAAEVSAAAVPVPRTCKRAEVQDAAVVTLVTNNEGYPAGALAISAALEVLDSALRRIVLVTPAVDPGLRELLHAAAWEVHEVPTIACHQVLGAGVTADQYDLGADYQAKRAKWSATCSKFHAWSLTSLRKVRGATDACNRRRVSGEQARGATPASHAYACSACACARAPALIRLCAVGLPACAPPPLPGSPSQVIFLDADTLVLRPIDSLVDHPSDFAAAPDTFPADQFNSGVMVITPSATRFEELRAWNDVNGTAEGGDQCLLNEVGSGRCVLCGERAPRCRARPRAPSRCRRSMLARSRARASRVAARVALLRFTALAMRSSSGSGSTVRGTTRWRVDCRGA